MAGRLRIRTRLLRHGSRTVLLTYPGLRLGNYLYFALQAHIAARHGRELRVLDTGLGAEWYEVFPALASLMVPRIRPFDRREVIPPLFHQAYGADFNRDDLNRFVGEVLAFDAPPSFSTETLTINVRRGDYYASAEKARDFGFDIVAYLRLAIEQAEAAHPVERVIVVSDDVAWAAAAVVQARPGWDHCELVHGSAVDDLAALARSPRLVLANSTFSYWGAYLSDSIHDPATVYAPDLHSRSQHDAVAWQHAPSWVAVPTTPVPQVD